MTTGEDAAQVARRAATDDDKAEDECVVAAAGEERLLEDAVATSPEPPQSPSKGSAAKNKSFDDLLVDLGEFGPYQRRVYFLLFIPTIFSATHKLSWVFLGAQADHRCRLPSEEEAGGSVSYQLTEEQRDHFVWDGGELDKCTYLAENGSSVKCDHGYVYDRTMFGSSAVMDWDLVCDDSTWRATAQSIFMVGVLLGSYIFGDLSDRLGRKPVFFASVVIQTVFGLASGLAPGYWSFVFMRAVVGMTCSGVFLVSYVLAMEMVGPRMRVLAGTLCQYYYTLGFFLTAFLAYFLNHDWKLLQIVLTLPTVLFVSYWWIMPESTRWLITKGKYGQARTQIQKVARGNKVEVTDEQVDEMIDAAEQEQRTALAENQDRTLSILDLFKTPHLRAKSINLFFSWFVNSGTYYGLSLSASNLGGNPYFNFFLSAAVEIPAYIINLLLLNQPKIGRRLSLSGLMLVGGAALFLTILVPDKNVSIVVALSMVGKLAITSSYGVVYIFSTEQFPTEVRNVAIGGCSMSARIGGILCPYVNLLKDFWKPLPLIIYGCLAVAGGLFALLLPETLNKKLPETLAEGEKFGTEEQADGEEQDRGGEEQEGQGGERTDQSA